MTEPQRTPIEILAAAAERQRLVDSKDAEHALIWEMFAAMWGMMQPVMEDISFIARGMRTTVSIIMWTGKIAGALTAVGGLIILIALAAGA